MQVHSFCCTHYFTLHCGTCVIITPFSHLPNTGVFVSFILFVGLLPHLLAVLMRSCLLLLCEGTARHITFLAHYSILTWCHSIPPHLLHYYNFRCCKQDAFGGNTFLEICSLRMPIRIVPNKEMVSMPMSCVALRWHGPKSKEESIHHARTI